MNSWKSRLIACNHRSSCYGIAWAPCRKSEKVTSCFRQCAQRLDKIVASAVNGSKLWTWCPSTLHRCKVLQRHVETILIPCVSCYFLVHLYTTYLTIIVFDVAHQCIILTVAPTSALGTGGGTESGCAESKGGKPTAGNPTTDAPSVEGIEDLKPWLTINNMIRSWIINIIN